MDYQALSLKKHAEYKGKFSTSIKVPMETKEDLATYYSPGVAAPCLAIEQDPSKAYEYTSKNNTVAIISDGTAVLWLGNIGWLASLPVMEWKAALFKRFGGVDWVPIVLDTQDPEKVVETIKNIAPTFWGINIEDIKAPECFYIEEQLKKELNIPVFHDDQHGTAIVVLAGIINWLRITDRQIQDCKIVISWAGAAGIAIAKLLAKYGATNIIMYDSRGAIYQGRDNLNPYKESIAEYNKDNFQGRIQEWLSWADIFIGISKANLLTSDDISKMKKDSMVFALANPVPEIMPDEAKKWGALIVSTGRSDFPNQVNNVLAFPGLFRGVLDAWISVITDEHKLEVAQAIAHYINNPTPDYIVPTALDEGVAQSVAEAIKKVG